MMNLLLTAGPTREPIDAVRFLSNRSSGRMGLALAEAAMARGFNVSLVAGPTSVAWPNKVRVINVETTQQMHDAVLREFANHDLLIMAAAVSDFRVAWPMPGKLTRGELLMLHLAPTADILAAAGLLKRADQRTVGFSLTPADDRERAIEKLSRKHLDLIAWNGPATLDSEHVDAELFWPDGRRERLGSRSKRLFADNLLQRSMDLFPSMD